MNANIKAIFNDAEDKNLKGALNELLVCGNLCKLGFAARVLNNKNEAYDIAFSYKDRNYKCECKLDLLSETTGNFYFEVYNYTYSRPTGIINEDMQTFYTHTFFSDGKCFFLFGKR